MRRSLRVLAPAAAGATGLWLFWYSRTVRRLAVSWEQPDLPGGLDGFAVALYQATRTELLPGHRVDLVDNGRIFDAFLEEMRRARSSVHVLSYIWKPGPPGDALVEALTARAREGVTVRVLVDPVGSGGFKEHVLPRLVQAGAQARLFRPVEKKPLALMGRNHRKLVVVDGRVGFTGGFGIRPEWMGDARNPQEWRDVHVRVEGPAVRQMQQAFAQNWLETGGGLLPQEAFPPLPAEEGVRAGFVSSTDVKGPASAYWLTHLAVAAARRQLWVANSYFVPHAELLRLLVAKRREGVDVRLLLAGPRNDQPLVLDLQRGTYRELLEGGVRLWEYQPTMMHAKTMLVDGRLVVVGSINLDLLSQVALEEGSLVVDDAGVARELERRWEADLACARELTLDDFPRPTPLGRLSRHLRWLKGER